MTDVAERGGEAGVAPDTVRVSVLVERIQIDVSLPIDVPVALLIPELVRLRDESGGGDTSADDARRRVWVLRRGEPGGRLDADDTLRAAGVGVDELLHLVAERTLSAPTLYDDVVDAAAQLNQSRHQGWSAIAARRVGFLGAALGAVAWIGLMLTAEDLPGRVALLALSAVVVLVSIAAAAALTRFAGQADSGMAVGWSAMPIAAAAVWVGLTPFGDLVRGGGCVALILLSAASARLIGAGAAGYVAFGVLLGAAGAILVALAAGVPAALAGATVAVLGAVCCLAVPQVRRRSERAVRPGAEASTADDADFGARVAAERALRAGCYAGLAVAVGLGTVVAIRAAGGSEWAALTLAWAGAAALLLESTRAASGLERAAVAVPAVALAVTTAFLALGFGVATAVVGFAVVLAGSVGLAAAGVGSVRDARWLRIALDYGRYAAFAALVPVACWLAVGIMGGPR